MVDLRNNSNRHFIVGVVILALGLILLLDQIGLLDASRIFLFWPLALIYFGYHRFTRTSRMAGRFWGGFCLILGISLQAELLGYGHIRFDTIWPVLLICAGILLILKRYEQRSPWDNTPPGPPPAAGPTIDVPPGPPPPISGMDCPPDASASPPPVPPPGMTPGATATPPPNTAGASIPPFQAGGPQTHSNFAGDPAGPRWPQEFEKNMRDFGQRMDEFGERMHRKWQDPGNYSESGSPRLNEVNIFWGGKRRIISKNFSGGDIVTIFGGFDIDLRESDMLGNQIEIEVVSIFGGGDIRVPLGWEVVMDAVGIFGGCGDRTHHPDQPPPGATNPDGSRVPAPKRLIVKGVAIFGGLNVKN